MSCNEKIIGFIGGGNMAKAIVSGITAKGVVKNSQIIVSSPSESTLNDWKSLSVSTTHSNSEVVIKSDIIFFTFKPYQLNRVVNDLNGNEEFKKQISSQEKLFVSVLAGITLSTLYKQIRTFQHNPRLIRVMPNTPVMVGEGCSDGGKNFYLLLVLNYEPNYDYWYCFEPEIGGRGFNFQKYCTLSPEICFENNAQVKYCSYKGNKKTA